MAQTRVDQGPRVQQPFSEPQFARGPVDQPRRRPPQQASAPQGYAPQVAPQGYAPQPDPQGYAPQVGPQGYAPQAAQMQRPQVIIEDHDLRELTPDEQQSIRVIAQQAGAIVNDGQGPPFISVRSAKTSERALARLKTSFATSDDGTRIKFFRNPFTADGNPLTLGDTNAVHNIIAIDSVPLNADGTPAEGARPNPPILLQMPTPKSDSIRRNVVSGALWGASALLPGYIGAGIQTIAGLGLLIRGANLAINPDTRNEGVATLTTGAKHFMWGAVSLAMDWFTMGTFTAVTTGVGIALGAADGLHAIGHALTKPRPIEIRPATLPARIISKIFSAGEYITKPIAGADNGLAVMVARLFHRMPLIKRKGQRLEVPPSKKELAAQAAAQQGPMPQTVQGLDGTQYQIDPQSGLPIDPRTGMLIDPRTGALIDQRTGIPHNPETGAPIDRGEYEKILAMAMAQQQGGQMPQQQMPPAQAPQQDAVRRIG